MAQPDVRCTEFVEVVTDWMEGALDDADRVAVEMHLAICPHCSDYLAQLRRSVEVLRETPRVAPPTAARNALLDAFRRRVGDD
jgi:anti-sigma factor RsiW